MICQRKCYIGRYIDSLCQLTSRRKSSNVLKYDEYFSLDLNTISLQSEGLEDDAILKDCSEHIYLSDRLTGLDVLDHVEHDDFNEPGEVPFEFEKDGSMHFSADNVETSFFSDVELESSRPVFNQDQYYQSTPRVETDLEQSTRRFTPDIVLGSKKPNFYMHEAEPHIPARFRRPYYDDIIELSSSDLSCMYATYRNNMDIAWRRRAMRRSKPVTSFLLFAVMIMSPPFNCIYGGKSLYTSYSISRLKFGRDHFRRSMSIEIARRGLNEGLIGSHASQKSDQMNYISMNPFDSSIFCESSHSFSSIDTPSRRRTKLTSKYPWRYDQTSIDDRLGEYDYEFENLTDESTKIKEEKEQFESLKESERAAFRLLDSLPGTCILSDIFPVCEYTKSSISHIFQQLLWLANENLINLIEADNDIVVHKTM